MRIKLSIIPFELLRIISGVILMHLNPWFIFLSLGGLLFPTLRVLGLYKDLDEREFFSDEI